MHISMQNSPQHRSRHSRNLAQRSALSQNYLDTFSTRYHFQTSLRSASSTTAFQHPPLTTSASPGIPLSIPLCSTPSRHPSQHHLPSTSASQHVPQYHPLIHLSIVSRDSGPRTGRRTSIISQLSRGDD